MPSQNPMIKHAIWYFIARSWLDVLEEPPIKTDHGVGWLLIIQLKLQTMDTDDWLIKHYKPPIKANHGHGPLGDHTAQTTNQGRPWTRMIGWSYSTNHQSTNQGRPWPQVIGWSYSTIHQSRQTSHHWKHPSVWWMQRMMNMDTSLHLLRWISHYLIKAFTPKQIHIFSFYNIWRQSIHCLHYLIS